MVPPAVVVQALVPAAAHAPLQPTKTFPGSAVGVSVTAPAGKVALQTEPQSIPAGVDTIRPPALRRMSMRRSGPPKATSTVRTAVEVSTSHWSPITALHPVHAVNVEPAAG